MLLVEYPHSSNLLSQVVFYLIFDRSIILLGIELLRQEIFLHFLTLNKDPVFLTGKFKFCTTRIYHVLVSIDIFGMTLQRVYLIVLWGHLLRAGGLWYFIGVFYDSRTTIWLHGTPSVELIQICRWLILECLNSIFQLFCFILCFSILRLIQQAILLELTFNA